MDVSQLLQGLVRPEAYPHAVANVEVRQTHISMVFLAGPFVYKIKKPVALSFLDFTTLEERRHFCEEEVRLNRRLAPSVYLGVVPITRTGDDLHIDGTGAAIEWAVKMRRLPEEATLQRRLVAGRVDVGVVDAVAKRIAAFHQHADTGERIAGFGSFDVVSGNARENFQQTEGHIGLTASRAVFDRLRMLTEAELTRLRPLIDRRARAGVIRDTHGDLHLDHIYLLTSETPPHDLLIIDCIEFNERFRFADPVADMAFVCMDLIFHGRRDLASSFANSYFQAIGDDTGRDLLPFYTAYRAVVRAKVEGIKLLEREVTPSERRDDWQKAHAHWLVALGELESPGQRPCLVLVGGLPGSGKSTLARGLATHASFDVIRSDVVRKGLAEVVEPAPRAGKRDIYDSDWNERTYAECLRRAEALLLDGRRVLVDATFKEEAKRQMFVDAARRWGVPILFLQCQANHDTARQRLAARCGDPSDADWAVYQLIAQAWEQVPREASYASRIIPSDDTADMVLTRAVGTLTAEGLA